MYIDSSHSELISALKWASGNRDHGGYTTASNEYTSSDEYCNCMLLELKSELDKVMTI